jgi:putative ATP-binding cassette transporter
MNESPRPPASLWTPLRMQWEAHPLLTIAMAVSGAANGAIGIAVIDTINSAMHEPDRRSQLLVQFLVLVAISIGTSVVSTVLPAYTRRRIITFLRLEACKRILAAPLRFSEARGVSNLLTVVSKDLPTVSDSLLLLPNVFVNAITVACVFVYIGYLSGFALVLMLGVILVGVAGYLFLHGRLIALFRRARDEEETFNRQIHGLVFGLKELKLHEGRRRWFRRADYGRSARRVGMYDFRGAMWGLGIETWSTIGYFALIGSLVFWVHSFQVVTPAALTASVVAILYVWGPMLNLFGAVPNLGEGKVACERLADFGLPLSVVPDKTPGIRPRQIKTAWRSIELRGVTLDYAGSGYDRQFQLGPIDLRFKPREIVFIAGGNGSGKTTLGKILTGLYTPGTGSVLLDGEPVADLDAYRSLFSAVLHDAYLFDRIATSADAASLAARTRDYLTTFGLTAKVRIADKSFSTTRELSQGERKRLMLLSAYMEDRPIYVLDEWAAEQDPAFKKFFYEVMIQDLKARGKCVVVITHDDRYFHLADRIIRLEDGRIAAMDQHAPAIGDRIEPEIRERKAKL